MAENNPPENPKNKGASQFCAKALLKGTESLCFSLLWVMFLQKRDASKNNSEDDSKNKHIEGDYVQGNKGDTINQSDSSGVNLNKGNINAHNVAGTININNNYYYLKTSSSDSVTSDSVHLKLSDIEAHCYREIQKTGALIRIRASKGMGKTSLMNRILEYAEKKDYKTVTWNFLGINQEVLQNLDQLLKSLCSRVNRELDLNQPIGDAWDEFASSNENCSYYFKKRVLPKCDKPLVLALDNVDRVFLYQEVASDFLMLLRSWHEEGKNNAVWEKLRLIVVHSTESHIPMKINHSPFNVGLPIELAELTSEQVQTLAQGYELNWSHAQIDKLMDMVGGHPYLINTAFNYCQMHSEMSVEEFVQKAPTQDSPYNSYLLKILNILQNNPQLKVEMRRVVEAAQALSIDPVLVFKLDSLGLIKKQENEVEPCNQLFRIYFRERL